MTAAADDPAARGGRSLITPEGVDLRLVLASAGDRAGAFLIDLLIIAGSLIALSLGALFLLAGVGLGNAEMVGLIWLVGFFLLRNGYFILFELTPRAATPGKRALGLRVVARDGGRLSAEAILTRNAMREIEVFLPLTLLAVGHASGEPVDAALSLLALTWSGVFMLFPLFNRDRLRVGDFVAGTWVVKARRPRLAGDLATTAISEGFAFTAVQVSAYGVKELQVLEGVIREADKRAMSEVARRIRRKIAWQGAMGETDAAFLTAYYAALRARLEHRLLFGHRRRDKFDTA